MKNLKIFTLSLVLIILIVGAFGCKQTATKTQKVLRVGTSADYPPFEYVNTETNDFVGFDLDLMRLLASKMGYGKTEIVNMDFDTIIPSLGTDKIDVASACITITDDRLKVADAVPYLQTGQSIIVMKESNFEPKSLKDLSGKKVGVQKGTTGEETLDKGIEAKEALNVDVRRYTSVILGMMDLQNGAIDAMIIDTPVANLYSTDYKYKTTVELVSETAGLFVKKGNTKLLDSLKKALEEVKGTKDWNDLMMKYFGAAK